MATTRRKTPKGEAKVSSKAARPKPATAKARPPAGSPWAALPDALARVASLARTKAMRTGDVDDLATARLLRAILRANVRLDDAARAWLRSAAGGDTRRTATAYLKAESERRTDRDLLVPAGDIVMTPKEATNWLIGEVARAFDYVDEHPRDAKRTEPESLAQMITLALLLSDETWELRATVEEFRDTSVLPKLAEDRRTVVASALGRVLHERQPTWSSRTTAEKVVRAALRAFGIPGRKPETLTR